jgi:hypothetical protein
MRLYEYQASEILSWLPSACADMAEGKSILGGKHTQEDCFYDNDTIGELLIQRVHDDSRAVVADSIGIVREMIMLTGEDHIKKICRKFLKRLKGD